MYLKIILYTSLVHFFIGCSTPYQSSGVALTRDIYIPKDNNRNISLIVNSFVDEIDKREIEKLIVSDLSNLGYHVSTQKIYSSTKLYVDLIELKSLITTQNSHFSFYNFLYGLSKVIAETKSINAFKEKRKKDFKEIPVYILVSKIKIENKSKKQETKIIAEEIEKSSKKMTLFGLEKKLSACILDIYKRENYE